MGFMDSKLDTKTLEKYLQRFGWRNYQVLVDNPQQATIATGWALAGGGPHVMTIGLDKKAQTLEFQLPGVGSAPRDKVTAGELADVLTAMAFSNFASHIGTFAYDPGDGEIRLRYSFPLDNSTMSYEQFERILQSLTHTTEIWAPRIASIASGERTGDSVMQSFVGHLRDAGII